MENNSGTQLLPLGTQVTVSDGAPRPPDRFKKKLADWQTHNYEGVVTEHDNGRYNIQRKPDGGWSSRTARLISFTQCGTRPERVKAIPGAFLAPLDKEHCVDLDAMIELEQARAAETSAEPQEG